MHKNTPINIKELDDYILIVDDEMGLREIFYELLENEGFKVLDARNGQEALTLLKSYSIFAVISDFKMPALNGVELCKKVKDINPNLPFILISAFTSDVKEILKYDDAHVDTVLQKPFSNHEITSVVKRYAQKRLESPKSA